MMVLETEIKMTGFDELEKVLKALPGELAKRDLNTSLRKGANHMRDAAQAKVPIDEGDLKDSLKVQKQKADNSEEVKLTLSPSKPKGFHAHFVEFGTVKNPAQPFMRPAFDETKGEATKIIIDYLANKVTKTAIKLSGNFAKSGLAKKRRFKR